MIGQSYFQLISPLIFLVFSLGFGLLWHYARYISALRFFSLAYFLGACAMMGDFLRKAMEPVVAIYVINPLYIATSVAFCAGLFTFYRGKVPWRALAAQSVVILLALTWFKFVQDDIVMRTMVMNANSAVLFGFAAIELRRDMRRLVDRILQVILLIYAFNMILRTLFVLWYDRLTLTEANYADSIAAMSVYFVVSIAALAMAGILFVMFGMEIVSKLTKTSWTDPLTGALNRRGLDARIAALPTEMPGTAAHAVVLADIDRFKKINDHYGHEAGDRVIIQFAHILTSAAREGDFIVRWGGEEFMVVMPGADVAMARLFAETVRAGFEAQRHDGIADVAVTASFGVAAWPASQPIADSAHLADRALYRAKRGGRNRVCIHGEAGLHAAVA